MNVRNLISTFISALLIFIAISPVQHDQIYHINEQYWVCISPEFNEYQTAAIWDGINIWNTLGRTHFLPETNGLCNILVRPVRGKEATRFEKKWNDEYVIGYAEVETNSVLIFIDKIYSLEELGITTCHEFGHYLNLFHIPMDRIAIMNPYKRHYVEGFRLYPADIEEYCRHWNCKDIDTSKIIWMQDTISPIDAGNDLNTNLNEETYDNQTDQRHSTWF